jgi:N-methylhydantoinase A
MMLTNGMVQTVEQTIDKAVYLLHSGPAAAPSAAVYLGDLVGEKNILSVDMGGTSFDVCLVRDREIPTTTESWVGDQRVGIKMVDLETLGAGGGSIASIDGLGLLKVGPESATADPGPACFGRGMEPTVTDADLVLGYVPADYFLGGEIQLDPALAEKAIEKVAEPLNMDVVEAAQSIFDSVNASMAGQITEVSTKQGYDVRDTTMVAGGGAGAVHAGFIAESLGIPKVVIPSTSGVYSAFGMFAMEPGQDFARTFVTRLEVTDPAAMTEMYESMEAEAVDAFATMGVEQDQIVFQRTAEMRHIGQFHEVETEVPGGKLSSDSLKVAEQTFRDKHEHLYAFSMPWKGVEQLTLRLKATTPRVPFHLQAMEANSADASRAFKRSRSCYFGGQKVITSVYDGDKLSSGNTVPGPAIIEEATTTVVIPEQFTCSVDSYKNYILTRNQDSD